LQANATKYQTRYKKTGPGGRYAILLFSFYNHAPGEGKSVVIRQAR